MKFQGFISKNDLADVLKAIEAGSKSGTLGLNYRDRNTLFCFNDGAVVSVHAADCPVRLGDRLAASKWIEKRQIDELFEANGKTQNGDRLGQMLVNKGLIDKGQLETAMFEHASDILTRVSIWQGGRYRFYEGKFPGRRDTDLALPIGSLLDKSAETYSGLYASFARLAQDDITIELQATDRTDSNIELTPSEWNTLALCVKYKTINQIIFHSPLDPLATIAILKLFLEYRLVEFNRIGDIVKPETDQTRLGKSIDSLTDLLRDFLELS